MEAGWRGQAMELDVSGIGIAPVQDFSRKIVKQQEAVAEKTEQQNSQQIKEITRNIEKLREQIDAEKYFHQILNLPGVFNKRLKFQVDNEQLIVKVINSETDKVIKEIPPEELRRMYERIREYVGLIIDEKI
jgi:flagellar protein FlaG